MKGDRRTIGASRGAVKKGASPATIDWPKQLVPWLCMCVLMMAMVRPADSTSVFTGDSLPIVLVVFLATLLAAWAKMFPWPTRANRWTCVLLGGGALALLVSTVAADWLSNGRAAWNCFWHFTALALYGLLVTRVCSRHPAVARCFAVLVFATSVAMAGYAIYQVCWSMPETRREYERNPEAVLRAQGIDAPPGSALRVLYENRIYSTEPIATYALANSLAVLLAMGILLALCFAIDMTKQVHHLRKWNLIAHGSLLLLLALALVLTKSRTAYLAVAVSVGLGLLFLRWNSTQSRRLVQPNRSWILIAISLMVVGSVGLAIFVLSSDQLILTEAPKSILYRVEYWQATARMILEHPWFGVGFGNFQSYYPRYKLPQASETIADPHNWILDIAANGSVTLLLITLLGGLWAMRNIARLTIAEQLGDRLLTASNDHEGSPIQGQSNSSDGMRQAAELQPELFSFWMRALLAWGFVCGVSSMLLGNIEWLPCGLGLIVGIVAVGTLWPWMRNEKSQVHLASSLASITALLCLLATGSWQASGLAFPLLTLLCLAATSHKNLDSPLGVTQDVRPSHRFRPAIIGVVIAGMVVFVVQTWLPVVNSWILLQQSSYLARSPDEAERLTREAIAADPIDPMPRVHLVQQMISRLEFSAENPTREFLSSLQNATVDLLQCDSTNNLHWKVCGEAFLSAAAALERQKAVLGSDSGNDRLSSEAQRILAEANRFFVEAKERNPTSIQLQVQCALTEYLGGDRAVAASMALKAIENSQATPHQDRKLESQTIWLPQGIRGLPAEAVRRISSESSWCDASSLCQWLAETEPSPSAR